MRKPNIRPEAKPSSCQLFSKNCYLLQFYLACCAEMICKNSKNRLDKGYPMIEQKGCVDTAEALLAAANTT